jgi:hypothetical protein
MVKKIIWWVVGIVAGAALFIYLANISGLSNGH